MNSDSAPSEPAPPRIGRRDAIKWLLLAAGGATVRPSLRSSASPTAVGYGPDPDLMRSYAPGDLWPLSFTPAQHRTAATLCDTILPVEPTSPGAMAVFVQDFIDEWISAPYAAQRQDRNLILTGLDSIDTESRRRTNRSFHELDESGRRTICDLVCQGEFFRRYRELTLGGFFTTREGEKDLRFIGNAPSRAFAGPSDEILAQLGVKGGPSPGQLGLQLWSLRDRFQADGPAALGIVRELGFQIVELAGTYGQTAGPFRDQLRAHGLRPVGAHFSWDQFDQDLPGVLTQARALQVEYVALPSIHYGKGTFGEAEARAAAKKLDRWAEAIDVEGMRFALHTHGDEFQPTEKGEIPFDILMNATRPDLVYLEMDVFWVTHAGADPTKLLSRYPGRWKLLHLRDCRRGTATDATGHAPPETDVSVGSGMIHWPGVFAAASLAGVEYSFIEDESAAPLERIPASVRYLARLPSFQQM